jgi:ribosomal protein S18 acetylase RimI-like enzyme
VTQVRRFVLNNLRTGAAQFAAMDDGQVVGWCDVTPKAREAMRHSGVLGMGVAASHRRRGIGLRLLDEALGAAFAGGLTRVELAVLVDNTPAVALYRKSGFETEGLCRRYLVLDGVAHDAFLMAQLT